jgi:hypothetical protein
MLLAVIGNTVHPVAGFTRFQTKKKEKIVDRRPLITSNILITSLLGTLPLLRITEGGGGERLNPQSLPPSPINTVSELLVKPTSNQKTRLEEEEEERDLINDLKRLVLSLVSCGQVRAPFAGRRVKVKTTRNRRGFGSGEVSRLAPGVNSCGVIQRTAPGPKLCLNVASINLPHHQNVTQNVC